MTMGKDNKRHWILTILCIMTFIGSGFGIVVSVLAVIDLDLIRFIRNIPFYTSVITHIGDSNFSYSIIKGLLNILSLSGAIYMWNLRKRGFYFYSAAQLLLPVISFIFFPYPLKQILTIVIPEYIFAFAFIALYALHLNSMKRSSEFVVVDKSTVPASDNDNQA
jgi:hypothetical protein